MEVLYTSLHKNKRVRPRTPRGNNNQIEKLEADNAILLNKLNEIMNLKTELESEYEKVLYEKEDTLRMLEGELDFNNEMELKYTNLLKKTTSQENMLKRSKNVKNTPRVSRRAAFKPPPIKPKKVVRFKKQNNSKTSDGNIN